MKAIKIASLKIEELPEVLELLRGLAEFEKLLDQFEVTLESLREQFFCEKPVAKMLVGRVDDEIKGYAIYFNNFSSFRCKPGMYLEDLYVDPNTRGLGLGKALLKEVARIAQAQGCVRYEWVVLDWNTKAQEFYESLGAKPLNDWIVYRMEEAAISSLAEGK
ncbi:GNAT family N-acetyltransferase [bacterium]|nr:GNAT family N-acetyltransferase [bacterium]